MLNYIRRNVAQLSRAQVLETNLSLEDWKK